MIVRMNPAMVITQAQIPATRPKPLKLVAVGDSLTSGFQDATLVAERQEFSYPAQIAKQAGIDFKQPLIGGRGIPPRVFDEKNISLVGTVWRYLQVGAAVSIPTAVIAMGFVPHESVLWPLYYSGGMGQSMEGHQKDLQNLAVPNVELRHINGVANVSDLMRDMAEKRTRTGGLMMLAPYVHTILQESEGARNGKSQVDRCVDQNPDVIVFWAGNNDALESVNGGIVDDRTLTPLDDQKWSYHVDNPLTGRSWIKETETVNPGFRTSLDETVNRLLNETTAEVAMLNIPDVTVIPYLMKVGEKVGPLPYKVVLPNGTDVTAKLENWVIPDTIRGEGLEGRTQFPAGSRIGLKDLLVKFVQSGEIFSESEMTERLDEAAKKGLMTEDEVLDPDEVARIQKRIGEFNQLLADTAAANPRLHLVDANALLSRAKHDGMVLRGSGDAITVTNVPTGTQDTRGYAGIFSYDGMHPSNVGHAVIANAVMDKLKADLGNNPRFDAITKAPEIDEREVLRQDPRNNKQGKLVLSGITLKKKWGFS